MSERTASTAPPPDTRPPPPDTRPPPPDTRPPPPDTRPPPPDTRPPDAAQSLPQQLLAAAERLLERPATETGGLWPRAAAILTRQALEHALADFLTDRAPGSQAAAFTTQLLLLRLLHPDPALAARAAYTWSALSRATHHHGYELNPTAPALRAWLATVDELVRATQGLCEA